MKKEVPIGRYQVEIEVEDLSKIESYEPGGAVALGTFGALMLALCPPVGVLALAGAATCAHGCDRGKGGDLLGSLPGAEEEMLSVIESALDSGTAHGEFTIRRDIQKEEKKDREFYHTGYVERKISWCIVGFNWG